MALQEEVDYPVGTLLGRLRPRGVSSWQIATRMLFSVLRQTPGIAAFRPCSDA
jgi:hypothetical protein